jgi:hypothetical protein
MGEAEKQILQMLSDGVINAEEADKLLSALGPEDDVTTVAGDAVLTAGTGSEPDDPLPPDFQRMRRRWRVPLLIAGGSLLLSTAGLALMYQASTDVALIGFLCVWSIFILALVATFIVLLARRSTWLYVNIDQKEGRRISFGFPVPVRWAGGVVRVARRFVPGDARRQLENADTLLSTFAENQAGDPLIIDIDDEDGDRVQVYLG